MSIEQWAIAVGSTWYIAFVVSSSAGPFNVFKWLREHMPLGGLTSCIICLSPWVAGVILYLITGRLLPLEALAVAGISLWIHGYSSWLHVR